jgi:hypothetical protein
MVNTRAGFWLHLATVVITALVVIVRLVVGDAADHTFAAVLDVGVKPAAVLLPIAGILLVTSEWSQRTGMITFALVPVRSRVLGAKLIASLVVAVGTLVMAVVVVTAGVLVASPGDSTGRRGLRVAGEDGRGPESLDGRVDAERQLPEELRDGRDALARAPRFDDVEQDGDPRGADQRPSDEPQHRHARWHQAGPVHEVTEHQPVADADDEAGAEDERPVVEGDERPSDRVERRGVGRLRPPGPDAR